MSKQQISNLKSQIPIRLRCKYGGFKSTIVRHRRTFAFFTLHFSLCTFLLLSAFRGEARAGVLYYGDAQVTTTVTIDANDLLKIRQNAGGYPGVPLMGNADASGHDCRLAVSDGLAIRQYLLGFRSDLPVFDPSPCWAIGLTITNGDGQDGPTNQTLPQPLEVELNNLPDCTQTISGCTRGGVTVTYKITGDSTGGATLPGPVTTLDAVTDSSGKVNPEVYLTLGSGPGTVTVVASVDLYTANGFSLTTVSATFTAVAIGCGISSVGPTTGCSGVTEVTINGTNFGQNPGAVTFNGTGATVTSWGDTSISVLVPGGDYNNVTVTPLTVNECNRPDTYSYDNTKPTVTISEPIAEECINSSVVVLNGTAEDGTGSGIAAVLVNGQTASGTYSWSITFTDQYGEPIEVGSRNTLGISYGAYITGDYAYVADWNSGLAIIDVSDPANPCTPVYRATSGTSHGVYVSGDYAYVADGGSGLAIIDVSDPTSPCTPVYRDTDGDSYGVYVAGGYAYVADGSSGLAIIDVSDPENPDPPVYRDTSGNSYGVYVAGGYAYVADYGSGLAIIDVSDPANPRPPVYRKNSGLSRGVYVIGGYAYVAYWNYGLRIIDISCFAPRIYDAIAVDNCGNISDPAMVNVTTDTTANVSITNPGNGESIPAGDVFVGGTADTDITEVNVSSNQGHNIDVPVDSEGEWSVVLGVTVSSIIIDIEGEDNCNNPASDSVTVPVVPPACSISIATPTTGCPGISVTINGTSFGGAMSGSVSFDSVTATIISWDDYVVDVGAPGGDFLIVQVTTSSGGKCSLAGNYSYDNVPPPPPTINYPVDGSIFTVTTIDTSITCAEGICQQRLDWGAWMSNCTTTFYGVTHGPHLLEAKCTDNCSNDSVIVTSSFWVDTVGPWIISTNPENGRTDVRTGVNIEIKFSENMDKDSVQDGFSLSSGTVGLNGECYWGSDDTVTFVTPDLLNDNTTYTVNLVGAADLAGYSLTTTGSLPFDFTTGDCTPPLVVSQDPDGNTLVDASGLTQITITFNESMDTTRGWMKIRDTYGNEVVQAEVGGGSFGGSLTWSGRILILDLDSPSLIQEGAGYNIEAWDLNDQSGNWIWGDVRWSFVTQGPVSDTDPPQLTLSLPYDGQTGVPRKLYNFAQNAIMLAFDEALDPFTFTQINPVGIFSDDFESGDLIVGGWSFTTGASVDNTPVFANNLDSRSNWWGYFNYGGKIWKVVDTGSYVDIQLNYQLSMFGLEVGEYFTVEYSTNGGSSWNIIEEIEGDGGNWLSWQGRSFDLSALDPAVEDNPQFAIRFGQNANGPADISTLDNMTLTGKLDTISLTDSSGPVSFNINWDVGEGPSPFSIRLIPGLPLNPLETYTIGISGGIKDSAGNNFVPQSISFTTADEPDDNDPPLVEATVPADGWIDLDWGGIEGDVGFNEPIDYSTVNITAINLKETNTEIPLKGLRVEEQEVGEPITWHLRFWSTRAFPGMKPNTQYTLTISSGNISDIGGNLLTDYSWIFTTVPDGPGTGIQPDNRLPRIWEVWPDVNAMSFENGNVTIELEIDAQDEDPLTVWVEDYLNNVWTLSAPTGSDRYEYQTTVTGDYDSGDEPYITYDGWQTFTFYVDDGQPGHTISVSNQVYIWPTADLPNQVYPLYDDIITAGDPVTLEWQNVDTANAVFLIGQYHNLITDEQGMCYEFPEFTQTTLTGLSPGLYVWMIGQMASVHGETFEAGGTGVGYQGIGVSNFTVADPALGSISGTITYGGPAGGAIFVVAYTNSTFTGDPVEGAIIPDPGNYTIYNLPDDTYYVRSFRDANGNMEEDWFEPWGYYDVPSPPDPVTITGGTNKQGINITLTDPI
jgi:hypothetical protein